MKIGSVSVFCATAVPSKEYEIIAYKTGEVLAKSGFDVISAGGDGMMNALCQGAFESSGKVFGLRIKDSKHIQSKYLTDVEFYPDFDSRHKALIERGDAFVILPGGIGTMLEAFTIIQKKRFKELPNECPIIFVGNYFLKLSNLLKQYSKAGFISEKIENTYNFIKTAEELPEILKR